MLSAPPSPPLHSARLYILRTSLFTLRNSSPHLPNSPRITSPASLLLSIRKGNMQYFPLLFWWSAKPLILFQLQTMTKRPSFSIMLRSVSETTEVPAGDRSTCGGVALEQLGGRGLYRHQHWHHPCRRRVHVEGSSCLRYTIQCGKGENFCCENFLGPHFVTCFCLFQDDEGAWSPIFFFPIVEIPHQVLSENLGGKIMDNAIDYSFR